MFLSPSEREEIGKELAALLKESKDSKTFDKKIKSAATKIHEAKLKDAADIALFGRMVATDHSLTVEGAAINSVMRCQRIARTTTLISTLRVDDLQQEDPTVEDEDRSGKRVHDGNDRVHIVAVYYRYVGLNLGLLGDESHLGALRQKIVEG